MWELVVVNCTCLAVSAYILSKESKQKEKKD